jgi:hypothetical protein
VSEPSAIMAVISASVSGPRVSLPIRSEKWRMETGPAFCGVSPACGVAMFTQDQWGRRYPLQIGKEPFLLKFLDG